jgi:hypothetical protein
MCSKVVLTQCAQCLQQVGFWRYTEEKDERILYTWAYEFKRHPALKDLWFGEKMSVGIYKTSTDWSVRFVPNAAHEEYGVRARERFEKCMRERFPEVQMSVEPVKELDFR